MSGSRSRSRSRNKSRSRTLSRNRNRSKSRSTSRSRNRSRSMSRSRNRSRSKSMSRNRSRSRSGNMSRSRSMSRIRNMSRRAQPLVGVAITELYHRFHKRHKLKWLESQTPYDCSGCKEPGHGPRYGCTKSSCNFNLHWDCTFTTFHASHHFYENCQLKFFDRPQKSSTNAWTCDACLDDIRGFVYHCESGRKYHRCCETGKDLHPTCRNLPPVREVTVDREAVIFRLARKMKEKCALCGEKYLAVDETGWSYVSACKTYHVHVACVAHVRNQSAVQRMERKTSLPVVVRNNGGRSSKYWKIIKFATQFIMSLLSGNPASLAFTLLEPLLHNLLSEMKL